MRESLKTTDIIIGKDTNKLSLGSDGSLLLQDTLIGPVKLSDLVGGQVVIDPALVILIEQTDWTPQTIQGQLMYTVTIPHNWDLQNVNDPDDLLPIGVIVNVWNQNNELITLNKISVDANNVFLESTKNINIKVTVKRIN